MGKSSSQKTTSKPVFMPGQKDAYQTLLGSAMGQMGMGGTQGYSAPQATGKGMGGGFPMMGAFGGSPLGGFLGRLLGGNQQQAAQPTAAQPSIWDTLAQGYEGQFTAPMGEGEQFGVDWMRSVLEGAYDPRTSDFYQGLRTQAEEDLQRALTGTRQSAAMGGMLASTPRIGQEGQLQRQMTGDLSTLLGGMYEQERARQHALAPQYMEAAGIPRQIEQQQLQMQYADWLRQLQAMGLPLQTALQLITHQAGSQQTTSGGGGFDLGGLSPIIAALI